MATFRQTLKQSMLAYPTLYTNPIQVAEHLFAVIGNGYDWIDGEMVDRFDKNEERTTMKYPEPRVYKEYEGLEKFHAAQKLKDEAERLRMKFTEDNLDAILDGSLTNEYFGSSHSTYITKHICTKYADGLNFPDDIKPDWAEALYEFLNYWLYRLNAEYGTGSKENPFAGWPTDVVEAHALIKETRNRLHPFAHKGQTFEQHVAVNKEFFDSIKDLLK